MYSATPSGPKYCRYSLSGDNTSLLKSPFQAPTTLSVSRALLLDPRGPQRRNYWQWPASLLLLNTLSNSHYKCTMEAKDSFNAYMPCLLQPKAEQYTALATVQPPLHAQTRRATRKLIDKKLPWIAKSSCHHSASCQQVLKACGKEESACKNHPNFKYILLHRAPNH